MKRNIISTIKFTAIIILFVLLIIWNREPMIGGIGIMFSAFHIVTAVCENKKFMWTRFIIPVIPVIIFTITIFNGFFPSGSASFAFGPWSELSFAFHLFYLIVLLPIAINVIFCNTWIDKFFLIASSLFCIGIAVFQFYYFYHFSPVEDEIGYPYFIGLVVLLAIVVLVFPKKSQFRRSQDDGNLQHVQVVTDPIKD